MTIGSISAVSSTSSLLGGGSTLSQLAAQSAFLQELGAAGSSASSDTSSLISSAAELLSGQVGSLLPAASSAFSSSYSLPEDVIGASVALRAYAGTRELTESIVSTLA